MPLSSVRPAYPADVRIGVAIFVELVIPLNDAATNNYAAAPLSKDNVARLDFARELPERERGVLLRVLATVQGAQVLADVFLAGVFLDVAELAPADAHYATCVEVIPPRGTVSRGVGPVMCGLNPLVSKGIFFRLFGCSLLGDLPLAVDALRLHEGGSRQRGEVCIRALFASELRLDGVANGEVAISVMNWRVLFLRHYVGDGGASLCDVGHEPAVARIQADEVVGPRPVEAHGEFPAKCELDDGGIECLDEGLPGFLVVVGGQCKFGLEHVPEVIDVVLAATFVVGEGIEGRVEVVEHGDALEVRGLICPNVEHLGDAGDDLLPVCVCDALVEEAEDGERIDVLQLICLKLRETHPDRFIDSC